MGIPPFANDLRIAFVIPRSVKNGMSNSWPSEPARKVTFLRTVSSAGSKIGNYFLALKDSDSGNRASSQLPKNLCPDLTLLANSYRRSFTRLNIPGEPMDFSKYSSSLSSTIS